ncbi:hypothetical protein ACFQPA_05835 [Halomarina halobia]|uniref:Uncharacterized protein n=1 Tax=Halomarina halobia TaxID=3033386 RepID=A0ABD6A706_9EURY|nr:hypothetical protein [Halomarina sp. PSR21]
MSALRPTARGRIRGSRRGRRGGYQFDRVENDTRWGEDLLVIEDDTEREVAFEVVVAGKDDPVVRDHERADLVVVRIGTERSVGSLDRV